MHNPWSFAECMVAAACGVLAPICVLMATVQWVKVAYVILIEYVCWLLFWHVIFDQFMK